MDVRKPGFKELLCPLLNNLLATFSSWEIFGLENGEGIFLIAPPVALPKDLTTFVVAELTFLVALPTLLVTLPTLLVTESTFLVTLRVVLLAIFLEDPANPEAICITLVGSPKNSLNV
jgi:hypothetical protein